MTQIFHYWVKFNFNKIESITHNKNGYTAASNEDGTIVVWKNINVGPNLDEGELVTIIIDQFSKIDQLQWVVNTNNLLIRSGDKVRIWDIFTNSQQASYFTTEPIFFAKGISIGFLLVKISGKFTLYTEDREITSHLTSDLIVDSQDGIFVYPSLFHVVEGEWIEEELGMSWGERGIRRRFEGLNDVQINGDLLYLDTEEIGDLTLPEAFRHYFEDCGTIVIRNFYHAYLIKSRKIGVLLWKGLDEAVLVNQNEQIVHSSVHPMYLARGDISESKIRVKQSKLIKEPLTTDLKNKDLRLNNIPPSFYLDPSQDLRYARYQKKHAFLWYPDQREDYVFIDLLTHEGSIFTDLGRKRHSYIQVTDDATKLMEWNRGKHYPSGTLKLYDLLNPENEPKILYDEKIKTQRIDEDKFFEGEEIDVDFPLIIPEWHKIDLWIYTEEPVEKIEISYSQYFMMLERWSNSENTAILDYPDFTPEEDAFVLFGDLKLELSDKEINFENIAPEWTFHLQTGLLAYYTIDGFCYIINTFDPHLLPFHSFETNLPYRIEFSPSGLHIVYLSFDLRETSIITHPQDGFKHQIQTEYPYIQIEVHNIGTKNKFVRSARFPILIDFDQIEVEFRKSQILVYFPSYTDNTEETVILFDIETEKFHQVNGSQNYRLWMTHSRNSPHSRLGKGEEFPIVKHPEIRRDHTMRPFKLYEGVMVRKEDQKAISMADINLKRQAQQSTADIFDLDNTTEVKLPFYYEERMKPIYLDRDKISQKTIEQMKPLSRISDVPGLLNFNLEDLPRLNSIRKRMAQHILNQLNQEIVHSEEGIAYQHPKFEEFKELMKKRLKKYRLMRFIPVGSID